MQGESYPGTDIDALRAYAARRVRFASLRAVGREMGVNHSTLHTFLHGREPGPRIRSLVCEWYYREMDDGRDAAAALGVLARFVSEPEQQRALRDDLLGAVERAILSAGKDVPRWIAGMRR